MRGNFRAVDVEHQHQHRGHAAGGIERRQRHAVFNVIVAAVQCGATGRLRAAQLGLPFEVVQ